MPKTIQNILYRLIALFLLILFVPFFVFLYFLVKTTSKGPFIFKQKRMGKDKRPFTIYKIRTMVEDAESRRNRLKSKNEADGPVFKIRNDPRYTKVGKIISHLGLDELPQLMNIINGEMSFVGPRPLPVEEAKKIPKKYRGRFSVLPGITSPWVVKGSHRLTFNRWMNLDIEYVNNNNFVRDILVGFQTVVLMVNGFIKKITDL